jgi:hypothetical protein
MHFRGVTAYMVRAAPVSSAWWRHGAVTIWRSGCGLWLRFAKCFSNLYKRHVPLAGDTAGFTMVMALTSRMVGLGGCLVQPSLTTQPNPTTRTFQTAVSALMQALHVDDAPCCLKSMLQILLSTRTPDQEHRTPSTWLSSANIFYINETTCQKCTHYRRWCIFRNRPPLAVRPDLEEVPKPLLCSSAKAIPIPVLRLNKCPLAEGRAAIGAFPDQDATPHTYLQVGEALGFACRGASIPDEW